MSMIIARKNDHPKILQKLKQKGFNCSIQELYTSKRFKCAANTAVIYHKERFDAILKVISKNPEFVFAGK